MVEIAIETFERIDFPNQRIILLQCLLQIMNTIVDGDDDNFADVVSLYFWLNIAISLSPNTYYPKAHCSLVVIKTLTISDIFCSSA